ncbi:MAG: hypothetical protein R2744_08310 [Bacteroidales bacterium]
MHPFYLTVRRRKFNLLNIRWASKRPISINSNLTTEDQWIISLHYGTGITLTKSDNRTGNFGILPDFKYDNATGLKDYGLRPGIVRYTFLPERRINPFIEGSVYWYYRHYVPPGTDPLFDNISEFTESKLSGYIAREYPYILKAEG